MDDLLKKFLELLEIDFVINIADIGAAAIAEEPVYKDLVKKGFAHLYAFDGDDRQKENITKKYKENATIISKFVLNGNEKTVFICDKESGMTSLLKPSKKYLEYFNGFPNFGKVFEEKKVMTYALDDV